MSKLMEAMGGTVAYEVRAPVGEGYYPASPDDELQGGVFRPADLLTGGDDGYVIVGRMSDVINVSGRKVNPSEIEQALRQCA